MSYDGGCGDIDCELCRQDANLAIDNQRGQHKKPKSQVRAYPSGAVRSVADQVAAGAVMPHPKPRKKAKS